ncbi:hypothetical protein DW945_22160 [Parabacteroides sp. AM44-16]|nr:hypothetical protein DW945_22160 [Parabacteroides sp. AM44-16]
MRASICAHFHWTYEYLLWGISWINVQMFIEDFPSAKSSASSQSETGQDDAKRVINQTFEKKEDLEAYLKKLV